MKEKVYKVLVILAILAAVILTTGCGGGEGPTSPSSDETCSGYGGGNEVGKWRIRSQYSDSMLEYTGNIYRSWRKGFIEYEFPYQKPQYNKIVIDKGGGRTSYQCYEVVGYTLRIFDGYYDRI